MGNLCKALQRIHNERKCLSFITNGYASGGDVVMKRRKIDKGPTGNLCKPRLR